MLFIFLVMQTALSTNTDTIVVINNFIAVFEGNDLGLKPKWFNSPVGTDSRVLFKVKQFLLNRRRTRRSD